MISALVIIRTPFQAWIASRVLAAECVEKYDLLYFTQDNAPEDRNYFSELATSAEKSSYLYARKRRFNIFNHLEFRWQARAWFERKSYDIILLGSIDAFIPNAISCIQSGELVTFDDGTANFNELSIYHIDNGSWRDKTYRYLFGAAKISTIKSRISRHYTLYPNFKNIVESARLKDVSKWLLRDVNILGNLNYQFPITYFIGGTFSDDLTPENCLELESYLRTLDIQFYVHHPREYCPLNIGVPGLNKHGLIAEDAILRHANGQPIHLVGWFSTVLFNMSSIAQRSTMLLFKSDPNSEHMATLARQSGCEIVFI